MFCTKCGKENEANATHCIECGEALTPAQPQAAAGPAQPQAAPATCDDCDFPGKLIHLTSLARQPIARRHLLPAIIAR